MFAFWHLNHSLVNIAPEYRSVHALGFYSVTVSVYASFAEGGSLAGNREQDNPNADTVTAFLRGATVYLMPQSWDVARMLLLLSHIP